MGLASRVVVPALLLTTSCGCGRGLYDLKAQVTLDGKPLPAAAVSLVSTGEQRNRTATGMTDDAGYVKFTTFEPNDGVLPGEYKVVVIKTPKSVDEEMGSYDRDNPEDMKRILARERSGNVNYTPSVLPRSYLNPEQTPLHCKVPPDNDEVVFALDSTIDKK